MDKKEKKMRQSASELLQQSQDVGLPFLLFVYYGTRIATRAVVSQEILVSMTYEIATQLEHPVETLQAIIAGIESKKEK